MEAKLPVTILTGFLGAGKTTLLTRILQERHGERIAVVENEFGEVSIDHALLVRGAAEQIIEMSNGCLCCTVRGDLVRILADLVKRRDEGRCEFDRVIVETTGLADPAPVAQTFFVEPEIAARFRLDGIVTVVDAVHAQAQLDNCHEAQEQVGFADRILVSKEDLSDPASVSRLRDRLMTMNGHAKIASVHFGRTALDELLDIAGFSLENALQIDADFLGDQDHEHDEDVRSFAYRSQTPFDAARLQAFFSDLAARHGANLMRYKGLLAFADCPEQIVVQGVHMTMQSDAIGPWPDDAPVESRLVFIGRDLPRETIVQALDACQST